MKKIYCGGCFDFGYLQPEMKIIPCESGADAAMKICAYVDALDEPKQPSPGEDDCAAVLTGKIPYCLQPECLIQ